MEYDTVRLDQMDVVGIAIRTSNEAAQAAEDLPPFWGNFYQYGVKEIIPHKKSPHVLGLYCEYEKDHTKPYTLLAGCEVIEVGPLREGLVAKHIPAAKYARFTIDGPFPRALMEVWEWLWEGNLKRTYTGDFEKYDPEFHPTENPKLELFIAIE